MSTVRACIAVAALAGVVTGCAGQQFVADKRLDIRSPRSRSTVHVPVTIRWTMSSPEPGGSYAVFVDRTPIKVGQTVRAVIDDTDGACKASPTCPDAAYLAGKDVYVTSTTSVTIPHITPLTSDASHPLHEVTVVLLDAHGKRTSEASWFRDFKVTGTSS